MLIPAHLIQKKRDGAELSNEEIRNFIRGLSDGSVEDYQATAFLMATYFRGMTTDETVALTQAMLESGVRYRLSKVKGPKVDKHSTGGVGDKVSIILAPLAAACGLKVPMMSGRGLGHSGGTLDKLESISGFQVRMTEDRFEQLLNQLGCAMIGQSADIAPADKKLYALRDVTATIECVPIICGSILSKKLAEGSEALVLDVKCGNGAFMKGRDQARKLAKALILVAKKLGLPCRALITNMNQPLGYAAGNALEIKECIEVMRNERNSECTDFVSADLKELTIQLCAQMLVLGKLVKNVSDGRKLAHSRLADGSAWKIFVDLVRAQGGDVEQVLNPSKLISAPRVVQWKAKKRGYITEMDTAQLGRLLVELGGGRKKASDSVDPAVGFLFHKKLGSSVKAGEPLVTVHAPERFDLTRLESEFHKAVQISGSRKPVPKLIFDVV